MNTPVKRTKSTALGKKCYPVHGPSKHRKGHFSSENDRRAIRYQKGLYEYVITIYIWLLTLKKDFNAEKELSNFENGFNDII